MGVAPFALGAGDREVEELAGGVLVGEAAAPDEGIDPHSESPLPMTHTREQKTNGYTEVVRGRGVP